MPYYRDYEKSCQVLEAGISGTKLNFSDQRTKQVTIRLINKRSSIEYRESKKKATTLPLSLFNGVMYGGQSSTFDRHKRNKMQLKEGTDPPFHAWECISLLRQFSTLDLVIKD